MIFNEYIELLSDSKLTKANFDKAVWFAPIIPKNLSDYQQAVIDWYRGSEDDFDDEYLWTKKVFDNASPEITELYKKITAIENSMAVVKVKLSKNRMSDIIDILNGYIKQVNSIEKDIELSMKWQMNNKETITALKNRISEIVKETKEKALFVKEELTNRIKNISDETKQSLKIQEWKTKTEIEKIYNTLDKETKNIISIIDSKASFDEVKKALDMFPTKDEIFTSVYTKQEVDKKISSIKKWDITVLKNWWSTGWGTRWSITWTLSDQTDLQDALDNKADLVDWKVPASQLPSYVDDVVEVADFASLPVTWEIGKIYVTLDTWKIYRWSWTVYVEISAGISDHTLLTNIGTNTHAQIDTHIANTSNPHSVTKTQVGLWNVDNTSDLNKPISTATQTALDNKADIWDIPTLTSELTNDSWFITSSALSTKQDTLVSGTNIKTINGTSVLWSGDLVVWGSSSKEIRITIPWQLSQDIGNYQGLYWKNTTGATVTISNVAVCVADAASGTWAACTVNVYKSSGTASDWINTSSVALFSSAIALGTANDSLTNTPTTTTVENGRFVSIRLTSVGWATTLPANLQCIITYS